MLLLGSIYPFICLQIARGELEKNAGVDSFMGLIDSNKLKRADLCCIMSQYMNIAYCPIQKHFLCSLSVYNGFDLEAADYLIT